MSRAAYLEFNSVWLGYTLAALAARAESLCMSAQHGDVTAILYGLGQDAKVFFHEGLLLRESAATRTQEPQH
jgi:hypothetical protein